MRLYQEFASWWPLMSAVEDYEEEAGLYAQALLDHATGPLKTVLELGSGGGHNAAFLKARFDMTLVEPAEGMLEASRALNPECEHVRGDMRTVRLDRTFDGVFVHDAVMYMTTLPDLKAAMETAYIHCRPGGVALFTPDYVRETFRPSTDCGGEDGPTDPDGPGRSMRYLEWTWDPDPTDDTYIVDYAYVLREGDAEPRVVHDRHTEGLFARQTWMDTLREVGFVPHRVPMEHSELEPGSYEGFIGLRPE